MLSPSEALRFMLTKITSITNTETVPIAHSRQRICAKDIPAPINAPPFDNSAMDGFAISCARTTAEKPIAISQTITAGCTPTPLTNHTAARIMTGACIPENADAVIINENSTLSADGHSVTFHKKATPGDNIRQAGQDIRREDIAIQEGAALTPAQIALLASLGVPQVTCYKPLNIALLTTGDELTPLGAPLERGKIYNSNDLMLTSLLHQAGFTDLHSYHIQDDLTATENTVVALAKKYDLIISTGGASVGDADFIKHAIERQGELHMWKVAMKPGKPIALGQINATPIICLPGNPASSFVTFCLFAWPLLQKRAGVKAPKQLITVSARAQFTQGTPNLRQNYLRAHYDSETQSVDIFSNQSSGMLSALANGNSLVIIPPNTTITEGDTVALLLLDSLR